MAAFDKQKLIENFQVKRSGAVPNPVLCYRSRSNLIESVHRGVACAVQLQDDGKPKIIFSSGNIDQVIYPRSAMKYIQILPLLESGAVEHYQFTDEEIAVMCASHYSEPHHLAVVRAILSKIGVTEDDLACGGHAPGCEVSMYQYIRESTLPVPMAVQKYPPTSSSKPFCEHIYNNCSGKHAGFLALAKYLNVPMAGHLDLSHPVQQLIRQTVCDVFDIKDACLHAGVDGCSAPAYAMSVHQLAVGFARLAAWEEYPCTRRRAAIGCMVRCITAYPLMVRGTHSFCSDLLTYGRGDVFGKVGAAGVYASGIISKRIGLAVKIDDGLMGPQFNVTSAFLCWINAIVIHKDDEHSDLAGEHKDAAESALSARMKNYLESVEYTSLDTVVGSLFVNPELFKVKYTE